MTGFSDSNDGSNASEQSNYNGEFNSIEPVVYPNPNKGTFSINWAGVTSGTVLLLSIYDLTGKHLLSVTSTVESAIKHDLKKGLYILKIQKEGLWYSQRIVVE